jgi:hypothetical protein
MKTKRFASEEEKGHSHALLRMPREGDFEERSALVGRKDSSIG